MCLGPRAIDLLGYARASAGPAAETQHVSRATHLPEERSSRMNRKADAMINGVAALLVLFVAMLDPWASIGLAVAFLVALAIYKTFGN